MATDRSFSQCVLHGPTPGTAARLRLSYARLFNSRVLAFVAAEFGLSPRESQMLVCTCKGLSVPRIAEILGCALGTAKIHRLRLYRKLGVECVEQAVVKTILASGLLLTDEDRDLIACRTDAEAIAWDAATAGKLAHHRDGKEE